MKNIYDKNKFIKKKGNLYFIHYIFNIYFTSLFNNN